MSNTLTTKLSQPLKWHGGKSYLASRIIEMMPPHIHYIEPFFGGGAVLFRKPIELIEGHSEVINDRYDSLMTFWKILQSDKEFQEFFRRISLTPFSKPAWEDAVEFAGKDRIDQAVAFFVKYRQSRQGIGKDFATMSRSRTRRGMNEQVSAWLSAVEGLPEAHQRLRRVVIFNENALKVIRREDSCESFFYCDPPYVAETRQVVNAYSFEMDNDSHVDLLDLLGSINGKFILSGYPSKMYMDAEKKFNWNRLDIQIDNKASSKRTKVIKTECLWSNY